MNINVYVEPSLLKGEALRTVCFIKELEDGWVLQSASPKTNNIDEYVKMSEKDILQMFPELNELFDLIPEKNISFRKGVNSGKWYDFPMR